jgi:hypothetical protein
MITVAEDALRQDIKQWSGLILTGAWAALASVVLIVVQVVIYLLWPTPETTRGLFEVLIENPLRGLLALDLLYVVSNLLAYLLYFALAVVLWPVSRSAVVIALAFGVLGMEAYMASPRPVEMLLLARSYATADPAEQVALLATGEGMLATWTGTAFDVYYVFNLVTLLLLALLMYRTEVFTRATAVWGLVAAALMAVPSNFGTAGLVFALASLLPWAVFAVLVARCLFPTGRRGSFTLTGGRLYSHHRTPASPKSALPGFASPAKSAAPRSGKFLAVSDAFPGCLSWSGDGNHASSASSIRLSVPALARCRMPRPSHSGQGLLQAALSVAAVKTAPWTSILPWSPAAREVSANSSRSGLRSGDCASSSPTPTMLRLPNSSPSSMIVVARRSTSIPTLLMQRRSSSS